MIRSLEQENRRISKLEKERLVLLRATSHELKTPLASLRIMLENMQLNIGEYQDRDRYLAESLAQVDRLTKMDSKSHALLDRREAIFQPLSL